MSNILLALLLSTLAGLSTTIGSVVAFIVRKPSKKFISFIMGFSAGVMILVSFVELLQEGIRTVGMFNGILFFLMGMGLMLLIDYGVTHYYEYEDGLCIEDNHEKRGRGRGRRNGRPHRHQNRKQLSQQKQLRKTSLLVTLGVFIHNFT